MLVLIRLRSMIIIIDSSGDHRHCPVGSGALLTRLTASLDAMSAEAGSITFARQPAGHQSSCAAQTAIRDGADYESLSFFSILRYLRRLRQTLCPAVGGLTDLIKSHH